MHLDHALAVIRAAALMKAAARWTLDAMQDVLYLANGLGSEMIELQEHGSLAGSKLVVELEHHLAGPVIALDEAPSLVVGSICAERPRNISTGRPVVILD